MESPASEVPVTAALVWLAKATGSVQVTIETLVVVSFEAVSESFAVLPTASVATTEYVMVPSSRPLRSKPENDHVPPVAIVEPVTSCAGVPSETVKAIVSPASAVPDTEPFNWLAAVTGSVNAVIATVVTVSLVADFESVAVFPTESVAVTE